MGWPFGGPRYALGASANPRRSPTMEKSWANMNAWQRGVQSATRENVPRLPERLRKNLLKRLRRWSWFRNIGGREYILLYRGMNPKEVAAGGEPVAGQWYQLPGKTSFSIDPGVAIQFSDRYGGRYIEAWVPADAISSSPHMYEDRTFKSGEMEIFVDPVPVFLQDAGRAGHRLRYRLILAAGEGGPFKAGWDEWQRQSKAASDLEEETGIPAKHVRPPFLPTFFRPDPPTPDAKTTAYDYRWNR